MNIRIVPRRLQGIVTLSSGKPEHIQGTVGETAHPQGNGTEGNWLQAAYWYAANFLGGDIDVRGVRSDSTQEARIIGTLYRRLRQSGDLEIDLSTCPDLLPPLAVMAAARWGSARFVRLGQPENHCRLLFVARTLRALGANVEIGADNLTISGGIHLQGNLLVSHAPSDLAYNGPLEKPADIVLDGIDDDQVVMAAAVAASASAVPVAILESETACKSYPDFFVHYQRLGGEIHIL